MATYGEEEVLTLLSINHGTLQRMMKNKKLDVMRKVGQKKPYFLKQQVDELKQLLEKTSGIEDIQAILNRDRFPIPRVTLRDYMERNFKCFSNPINSFDVRILREDVQPLVNYVYKTYKQK